MQLRFALSKLISSPLMSFDRLPIINVRISESIWLFVYVINIRQVYLNIVTVSGS